MDDALPTPAAIDVALTDITKLYPGVTALDAVGPWEVLSRMPDTEIRFVGKEIGPVVTEGDACSSVSRTRWPKLQTRTSCWCRAAGELVGRERAEAIQLNIEYDPHPPPRAQNRMAPSHRFRPYREIGDSQHHRR